MQILVLLTVSINLMLLLPMLSRFQPIQAYVWSYFIDYCYLLKHAFCTCTQISAWPGMNIMLNITSKDQLNGYAGTSVRLKSILMPPR